MRELEAHLNTGINNANRVELNVKKQQEIESVLEGTIKPKKGNIVWEINTVSMEIKKAEYKQTTAVFNALTEKPIEKLTVNSDCIYIPAHNKSAALNQYLKNKNQSHYFVKEPLLNLNDITF